VEAFVKVLDGCGSNANFWVFAAGLTNVKTLLAVTDTHTGRSRTYLNPQSTAFQPSQDVNAFSCAAEPPAAVSAPSRGALVRLNPDRRAAIAPAAARCTPSDTILCLGSRFAVTTRFSAGTGPVLSGHAVPLTADTGYFWFFDGSNVEEIVKVLDGCTLNHQYWVFAGGLTNVQVTTTVTDTTTGASRSYSNSQGTVFQPVQDTSALAVCP
jgi:hypothetical protein